MKLVAHYHEWPRVSTIVLLVLHCLSYLGLISLTFQPDIYASNELEAASSVTNTLPSSVDACQWAIEIVSLVGGVLSIAFIILFFLRPKILHPWIVAGIVGSLFIIWTVLIGFNCKNLKYQPHLKTGDGNAIAQMAAMYCLTTLVATTSLYLFLHSLSIKFTSREYHPPSHGKQPSQPGIPLTNLPKSARSSTMHNRSASSPDPEITPYRPISFTSPRLSVNTASFGRHSASTFGYQRARFGGDAQEWSEMSPIGTNRSEYQPIGVGEAR